MCTPGKPCPMVLDALRAKLETPLALALSEIVRAAAMEVLHARHSELHAHITTGMGARSPSVIGEVIMWALVAERIPDVVAERDAAAEVRGVMMRRILGPRALASRDAPEPRA